MFSPRKKNSAPNLAPKGATRAGSPLDRKQEALRAKEEQLKNAAAELQRLIDEAPRLREEQTRRRREVLASDARLRNGSRARSRATYQHNSVVDTQRPQSKQGDVAKFILLALALGVLIIWAVKLAIANLS